MKKIAIWILLVITPLVMGACLFVGAANLAIQDWPTPLGRAILCLRASRIAAAFVVGGALACSGVVLQALLRNPLAEPYVLGVSSGAGLGAAIAIVLGVTGAWILPGTAFLGALGTIILVYALARAPGGIVPVQTLLLSGVVVSAVLGSILMFIVSNSTAQNMHSVVWWLLGNLQIFDWTLLWVVGGVATIGLAVTFFMARALNLMTLGDESAAHLGLHVERTRGILFLVGSLMTGATVAACGLIGFVGLIVPHIMRLIVGPDHRRLIPATVLAGAAFMVMADTFARTVLAPVEIPVGVVTAFLGGPFFLFLLRRRKGAYRS